jgi:hypothetical protein
VFGPNGDIKPLALTVVKDHCAVTITPGSTAAADAATDTTSPEAADAATDTAAASIAVAAAAAPLQLQLEGGKGAVYHNGRALAEGEKVTLATYDRVALGMCTPITKVYLLSGSC